MTKNTYHNGEWRGVDWRQRMEKRRVVEIALKELHIFELQTNSNQNRNHNDRCFDNRNGSRIQMQNAFQTLAFCVESFDFEEQG